MDTSPQSFKKNLLLVETILQNEILKGEISEKLFADAYERFGNHYKKIDVDAKSQMNLIQELSDIRRNHPSEASSPYVIYKKIDLNTYRATLKKIFNEKMVFSKLDSPSFFFRFEYLILIFLSLYAGKILSRRLFLKRFVHTDQRAVRKMGTLFPFYLHVGAFGNFVILFICIQLGADVLWYSLDLSSKHFIVSLYLKTLIKIVALVLSIQYSMGRIAYKIILCDNKLFIKSLGYFSHCILYSEIVNISSLSQISLHLNSEKRKRVGLGSRFHHNDWPWKKGLYIELNNGKAFFIAVKNAETFQRELLNLMEKSKSDLRPFPMEAA